MIVPTIHQVTQDPELFAATFLKILNKEKELIPFRWNYAQKKFQRNRTGRDLILKARQLGFTTQIQGDLFRKAVTRTTNSLTLTHLGDATTKIRMMADRFYANCRFGDIQPQRQTANATMSHYTDFDSVAAIATAGSLETGRGDTYSDIHMSECAFYPDMDKILAGALQGGNPTVVLESTPNGAQGKFYNLCMDAIHGDPTWHLHFFPWWDDPSYKVELELDEVVSPSEEERLLMAQNKFVLTSEQLKWRRNKMRELGRLFVQEYPENIVQCFLTSGNGYFGDISHVFTAEPFPVYAPTHHYSAGLDFAQTDDYTALIVLDFTTKQMVELLHINMLPWAEMRRRVVQVCRKWHVDILLAENNSIGAPNIEALRMSSIYTIPFETNNERKASIMSSLHEALWHGGWALQDVPVLHNELNTFVADQLASGIWRLAADGEGHDDTVMALALAYESGRHTVSDEELRNYGSDVHETEDEFDDDMLAYRADGMGITVEQLKKQMAKE